MIHTLYPFTCTIDTGAEVNVISKEDYDRLNPNHQHRHLGPGLPHTEATPSRPLEPVHCTSMQMAVLKRSSSMLLMYQDLQCLVVKPVRNLS